MEEGWDGMGWDAWPRSPERAGLAWPVLASNCMRCVDLIWGEGGGERGEGWWKMECDVVEVELEVTERSKVRVALFPGGASKTCCPTPSWVRRKRRKRRKRRIGRKQKLGNVEQ